MSSHRNDVLKLTDNPLLLLEPISRHEAQERGRQHFLTTYECHRGHVAPRNVENGACVLCEAENFTGFRADGRPLFGAKG